METTIFKYGELPEFKKFTPESISKQFPEVLIKIGNDFKNIEEDLSNYLIQKKLDWNKVINPLNEVNEVLRWSWGVISHLNAVNNSKSLRDVYSKFLPEIISLSNRFGQSKVIYNSLVKLKETNNFDRIKNRILDKEILEMQHRGISLQKNDQKYFNEISEKLGKLSTDFSNNVLDATKNWFLILNKKSEVDGLPDRVLELMAISAHNHLKKDGEVNVINGPWKLSLDIPTYTAFMTYATDRKLREKLYKAFVSRASDGEKNNSQIIEEILSLRTKQANLLGYKSWAELSLSTKMAKEIKNVETLLEELREPAFKTAKLELQSLENFSKDNGFPHSQTIEPWDISYWSELLRKEKFNLDQEALRPWFPLNDVLKGLFKLSEKLFEIKVVEATDEAPSWNNDVLFFNILDKKEKKIASFYLDPYSRPESKRGGAWMDECLNKNNVGKNTLPVAYLVCNQTPPSKDKPSLMSFEEVQTLFHEFGHGLQHMLTTVNLPQAAGINNVEWDAVELPSQFMENWCFHKNTLLNIAKHYQTGEKLSDENFEKLLKNRTFNCGMDTLRQLHFAITDLRLHSNIDKNKGKTADKLRREIAEQTTVIAPIQEDQFLCCFSHIFAGGYSAGYYSYKWAEVLSADAFSMFEEADLENTEDLKLIGKKFKDTILSLGGSLSPLEIFKLFRGREPQTDPLIRHLGLSGTT
ncbi:oligopeptidase A, Metallo peptidase, MEROPS family M03A [Prochlorococcus marinus str. MIT 9312]|uniref:oligopeptidase A n=1 Tax=Prochlorococcus marinus (strain MIT 9312) TaxID=74546 RepID=Q31BU1_PROM9|nr:M3 family metallopeptidase [Prochlorococcus marinus]ABB49654.1 oligopeptidase A, Metallo peptidase, MEROPS family M03A [Prochlorococcus marinus str. MIT 9312]KGF99383.1 Oligopeptidase A [Prochlorococcus marinus str. MIT 9311]